MKKSYHSIAEPAIAASATFRTVDGLGAAACALEPVIHSSSNPFSEQPSRARLVSSALKPGYTIPPFPLHPWGQGYKTTGLESIVTSRMLPGADRAGLV